MRQSGTPLVILLSRSAQSDIREALVWSEQQFGAGAAERYRELLKQALRDIAVDPERAGSRDREEFGSGIRSYHVFFSRDRARSALGTVKKPRHFLIYRRRERVLEILRVLHDARDLERHLPEDEGRAAE